MTWLSVFGFLGAAAPGIVLLVMGRFWWGTWLWMRGHRKRVVELREMRRLLREPLVRDRKN